MFPEGLLSKVTFPRGESESMLDDWADSMKYTWGSSLLRKLPTRIDPTLSGS
jgi:hypothetical protein